MRQSREISIFSWCLKFDIFHLRSQQEAKGHILKTVFAGALFIFYTKMLKFSYLRKCFKIWGFLKYIETNVKIVHIFKMHETLYIYLSQQAGNYGTGRGILKKVSGFGLLLPMPRNNKQINSCRCRAGGQKYLQAGDCPR